jgi:hypothetical protein
VHVDVQTRILAHKRPGCRSVIEMDMREKNCAEIGDAKPLMRELLPKSVERRRRPGINEHSIFLRAK